MTKKVTDKINPDYYAQYNKDKMSFTDIIAYYELNFFEGSVIKYLLRAGKKPGEDYITDIKKAQWYMNKLIENWEKRND